VTRRRLLAATFGFVVVAHTDGPARADDASVAADAGEFADACGAPDEALERVARRLAENTSVDAHADRSRPMPEADELAGWLRAERVPHVWPRAFRMVARGSALASARATLAAWAGRTEPVGEKRCGVAVVKSASGATVVAAVLVDAVAELAALPQRVRPGEWFTVEATTLRSARSAHVVVMGPNGVPRRVPTAVRGRVVRARVALERAGIFRVQVVADLGSGPRPVLEADVFAGDETIPEVLSEPHVPGEDAVLGPSEDASDLLFRMTNVARQRAGLPPLRRSARLDRVAREHADRMRREQTAAHDLGEGDPAARLRAAGIPFRLVGENVAHAADVRRAHRALYASPSHRANTLRAQFEEAGVAVVHDERGAAWVVVLFAAGSR
jgi:hypothetical protein